MSIVVAAPAKVNLTLRVLGRRADGFHEIATVFQAVDLVDQVRVSPVPSGVSVEVRGADVGPERDNLAYRAADAFLSRFGGAGGVSVVLEKRIPAGAGLGGGSSDAAAVLRALAHLAPVRPDQEALLECAAELGSDVPFFLGETPRAWATGRGEELTSLPPLPEAHLVLALPPVHVGTAEAYRALARGPWSGEAALPASPVRDWSGVAAALANDFQDVVAGRHPEVAASLAALRDAGARGGSLSGSGAASFGIFGTQAEAERVAETLSAKFGWPFVAVKTLERWPEPRRLS